MKINIGGQWFDVEGFDLAMPPPSMAPLVEWSEIEFEITFDPAEAGAVLHRPEPWNWMCVYNYWPSMN
jgi:hypothetical protein